MITNPISPNGESDSPNINELWQTLSPEHQNILLEIAQAFSTQDRQSEGNVAVEDALHVERTKHNQELVDVLQENIDAYKRATPEERAQGQAELEDFQRSLNENRAPLPPLFI